MILSFSTRFPNGKPTYFIQKIWNGFIDQNVLNGILARGFFSEYTEKFNSNWDTKEGLHPKITTIRKDEHNRWKPGMKIHFVINNRSKNFFQFAPVIDCKSVQKIEIEYTNFSKDPIIVIDGTHFYNEKIGIDHGVKQLAQNDGFDSVDDFFEYFNTDFTGKIIHWTDLKY